jgi:hypothetical protein
VPIHNPNRAKKSRRHLPVDGLDPAWQHAGEMSEASNRFSLSREASKLAAPQKKRIHAGQTPISMMLRLARVLGHHETSWETTGLSHDLDYLRHPHHASEVRSQKAHPICIATAVYQLGPPSIMALPMLQHAPHLGLRPTAPLAQALVLCDGHATASGAGWQPAYPSSTPKCLLDCLQPASSGIQGFVRDDMMDRSVANLKALAKMVAEPTSVGDD